MLITDLFKLHDPLPQQNKIIRMMQDGITMWKSKTLHRRRACNLQMQDDKRASNTWLKFSELFPETTGFVIAIQDHSLVLIIIGSIF